MHQTKKGKQWYFGAKAHIGMDSKKTVVHSVVTSAASVADKHMLPTYCTVKSARYRAMAAIRARPRRFALLRRRRKI
jgi:IS5 family transposase